jgi:hypothetical protein
MLVESAVSTAQAVLLAYLLNFLQDPFANANDGYIFAAGLSASVIFVAIIHHVSFFHVSLQLNKLI